MGLVNLGMLLIGVALIGTGYLRAKGPWARYQALKEQDANVARYDAWRGGLRDRSGGETGASVAMQILRQQARIGAIVAGVGGALVLAALVLPSMP